MAEIVTENLGNEWGWKGGEILKNSDSILLYVRNYYESLLGNKDKGDVDLQTVFLDHIRESVTPHENEDLIKEVTSLELKKLINCMNKNKTPGIDGLPVEFYCKMWNIIGREFLRVVQLILKENALVTSQRMSVIALIPKDGDTRFIKNWRPISMLTVDYKIIAKLISNRLSLILPKLISKEQFCSIPGRNIIDCNLLIRDMVYYINDKNLKSALMSLDWSKAFDRVDMEFVFKVMSLMGINETFISWIRTLYKDISSRNLVNGLLTDSYSVFKSVRQGCPLSMILFVIYLEPFFRAIKENANISSPCLPGNVKISVLGFADDVNFFVSDENSVVIIAGIVSRFEKATGAKLNKEKTTIYGLGKWSQKVCWPLSWLNTKIDYVKILEIYHASKYSESVDLNWKNVSDKMRKRIGILCNRKLTLIQKSLISNAMLCSKLWYCAHIYPMPVHVYKMIKTMIFGYVWNNGYQPIKQVTLCLGRKDGGIGLIDVYKKCQSLLISSFVKMYCNESQMFILTYYYMYEKVNGIIVRERKNIKVSRIGSPFYRAIYKVLQVIQSMDIGQLCKSRLIYRELMNPKAVPTIEEKYPLFQWVEIWQNVNFKYIGVSDRNIVYRYIHDALPSKRKLHQIGIINNAICPECNVEETTIHTVYFCKKNEQIVRWFKKVIQNLCDIKFPQMLELLHYDIRLSNKRNKNVCIMLITAFIVDMWLSRDLKLNFRDAIHKLIGKIIVQKDFLFKSYGSRIFKHFNKKYINCNSQMLNTM